MATNFFSNSVPYPAPDRPFHVVMVPVPAEIKQEITRDNDRIRKKAQYYGKCCCPRSQICFCTGDCASCKYQLAGNLLSLDYTYSTDTNDEAISLYDLLGDEGASSFPDKIAQKNIVDEIIAYLQQVMPETLQVLKLQVSDGFSERQALEKLGIPRSTYRSRWDKVRNDLVLKFGQDLL